MRMLRRPFALLSLLLWPTQQAGCGGPARLELPTRCQLGYERERTSRAARAALRWLELAEVPTTLRPCPSSGRVLAGYRPTLRPGLAGIRSFGSGDGLLSRRSYIYDNALALLWFTFTEQTAQAKVLAETLAAVQLPDGAWGAYIPLDPDECLDGRYVRNGVVSWAAYALGRFARQHSHAGAEAAAHRAADYLIAQIETDRARTNAGLLRGGRGRWQGDPPRFEEDYAFISSVTEHQLDAHQALALLRPDAARGLSEAIVKRLWLADEGRFALAAHPEGLDRRRALDAAGAWGALWLQAQGRTDEARRSLAFTRRQFAARDRRLAGFRPYLDRVEEHGSAEREDLIFVEGTLALGLAGLRLDQPELARQALALASQIGCAARGGIPAANIEVDEFTLRPGAASTLWFLFLEAESRPGERSPVFSTPRTPGG